MNVMLLRVVLNVTSGTSAQAKRGFVWGTPVAPFSVGSSADWQICAPGVEATHLYLAFDGHRLHAASASAAHSVAAQGVEIGPSWVPLSVPSRLVFGAACIEIECEDIRPASHAPAAAAATGAAAPAPSPIRPRPIVDLSHPDRMQTKLVDLAQAMQLRTARFEISETVLAGLREAPAPEHDSLPSTKTLMYQPVPVATLAFPLPPNLASTLYDGGALRERAAQLACTECPSSASSASSSAPERDPRAVPALAPVGGVLSRPLAAFRRSSLPKKLTVLLLPLAVAGVWGMRDSGAWPSPVNAVPKTARPLKASATPVSVDEPRPEQPASNSNTAAAQAASATPSLPAAEARDPASDANERAALIAAFSGNKAEAAALYERLAATGHSRTFALAAQLMREDRVRKP